MKKTTLPISATVAYDKKSDTVLLTSADKKLEGSRFRVALRKDTVEDLKLRQLLTTAAEDAGEQPEVPEDVIPDTPIPVPLQNLTGLIPFGTTYNGEPVHWNTSKHPNALVVADDFHQRAAFSEMLFAAVRAQEDWTLLPLNTGEGRFDVELRLQTLEDEYIAPRYYKMREEGVVWHSDLSEDLKKVLVVVEVADTLHPEHERLLNRVLARGPAAGVTVLAISASVPDWQQRTLKNFSVKVLVGDYKAGVFTEESELLSYHRPGDVTITGPHAAILECRQQFAPFRFYGMPE